MQPQRMDGCLKMCHACTRVSFEGARRRRCGSLLLLMQCNRNCTACLYLYLNTKHTQTHTRETHLCALYGCNKVSCVFLCVCVLQWRGIAGAFASVMTAYKVIASRGARFARAHHNVRSIECDCALHIWYMYGMAHIVRIVCAVVYRKLRTHDRPPARLCETIELCAIRGMH